jgi:hypothetical protein
VPAAVPHDRQPLALAVLMVVLFLTFLDNTVVSVALGSVQSDLYLRPDRVRRPQALDHDPVSRASRGLARMLTAAFCRSAPP